MVKLNINNRVMPLANLNEITQDSLFFCLFIEIKKKLNSIDSKYYLSSFIKQLSSIFFREMELALEYYEEYSTFDDYKDFHQKVKSERNKIKKTVVNSNTSKSKINDLGIDYNKQIYDMQIYINSDNELLDFNIEEYNEYKDEDFDFWNNLYLFPRKILEKSLDRNWDNVFNNLMSYLSSVLIEIEEQTISQEYSYSSYKLFKHCFNLTNEDKTFILFRFRLLKSILLFDKIFLKGNILMSNSDDRVFNFDLKNYLRKYKAIVISIIGNDLMCLKTPFSSKIITELDNILPGDFYRINRKLRNHIHYVEEILPLSIKEEEILDKYQTLYLNYVYENILKNIDIEIDRECIAMSKAVQECRSKNMSVEEIKEKYQQYYLKYYYELEED